jgi:hypothetical protein
MLEYISKVSRSRSKAESKSLVSFVLGRRQIIHSLLSSHLILNGVPLLIRPDVVELSEDDNDDFPCQNAQEDLVAAVVVRLVIVAVDLRREDRPGLNSHVVEGRTEGAGADRSCIAGR